MTHAEKENEARHSSCRGMAASSFGFFTIKSLRRDVSPCGKIITRSMGVIRPERKRQRGFIAYPENTGCPRLVKSFQPSCSSPRVIRTWLINSNPKRHSLGLQLVCSNAISTALRPIQVRCFSWKLSSYGLHGGRRSTGKTSNLGKSSPLETCQKNANGSPATGRCMLKTSRHGTKQGNLKGEIRHFVPPRDKTPSFSCGYRPATGHLYRFTICMVFQWGNGSGKDPPDT